MSTQYFDYSIDPVTNIIYPYILRSASKGGTTTNKIGVEDLTIPATANFPSTNTTSAPSRYFLELPMDAYYTSTNTSSFSVKNETQNRTLTIITPTAALSNYTCKFTASGSEKKSILEIHVGSTSNQAGDTISYEGYFSGSILKSTVMDQIYVTNIISSGVITLQGTAVRIDTRIATQGESSPDSIIGGITLYSTGPGPFGKYQTFKNGTVNHGITNYAETDTIGVIGNSTINQSGFLIAGLTTGANGLFLQGINSTFTDASVIIDGAQKNGPSPDINALPPTSKVVSIRTFTSSLVNIFANGDLVAIGNLQSSGFVQSTASGVITKALSTSGFTPVNANFQIAFGPSSAKSNGWFGFVESGTTAYLAYSNQSTSYYFVTLAKS